MRYDIKGEWLTLYEGSCTLDELFSLWHIPVKKRQELFSMERVRLGYQPVFRGNIIADKVRLRVIPKGKEKNSGHMVSGFRVVYEDDFVLVVHKPRGLLIYDEKDVPTLNTAVLAYSHGAYPPRPVHRLDKETEGLVLYSKVPFFQPFYDAMLAEKKIRRDYLCRVRGSFPYQDYTCVLPLGRDRHHSGRFIVYPKGKKAITHVHKLYEKDGFSYLLCTLDTGRRHQIRVHLQALGYPIDGDELYGDRADRLYLFAFHLAFPDVISGKRRDVYLDHLADMDEALKKARRIMK